eukprot:TRINITY_DN13538_c0_g1_i1.p1 TRINITY_DN13538_c0_g1~~TRINITY_DN13538_c0_g1_i1.p1  ORF type:complete len:141 (+),score=21.12 TRINITY_DN13538_c0_g1_i1:45-425(+)
MVHAFLYELREQKSMSCDFDRLELSTAPELRENIELLGESIEDYASEQKKYRSYQKARNHQQKELEDFEASVKQENIRKRNAGEPEVSMRDAIKNKPNLKEVDTNQKDLDILLHSQPNESVIVTKC